jgi:peptidoglycan/xylan/chitin deacetylase (PgdA/CDA1 family)
MRQIRFFFFGVLFFISSFYCMTSLAENNINVPILVYHNFDPVKKGSMTISTARFEEQVKWLKNNGYNIIPLNTLVSYLLGKTNTLPAKSVVITADDGRESVYQYMLPIVLKYKIPVTLFVYPQIISHAPYALTWNQLAQLKNTGLFDIQGHTYWHPNFRQEKKRLSQSAYQKLVDVQLITSKNIIEKKLGIKVTLLAWPFGIYDQQLENDAKKAGYTMAFSIAAKDANRSMSNMAQPRFMIVEGQTMKTFEAIVRKR